MNKRVTKILSFIIILAIGILSIRLFVLLIPQKAEKADTQEGIDYVQSLESIGAQKAEQIVRTAQEEYAGAEKRKKIAEAIEEGNYRFAFQDVLIVGDSIVKAIYEYGILDGSQVFAEIGAGTAYLEDISGDIEARNPQYLVLHFGENQISSEDNATAFAEKYSALIEQLKEDLPNTDIYVDSIFPVDAKAYNNEPYLQNIDSYNKAIKKECDAIGITFIDYDSLWASFSKNYYDLDGIHPVSSFYTEQYLPYVLTEVGYEFDTQ